MKIGIDNLSINIEQDTIDLSKYNELDEKYVHAVDSRIDILFTSNEDTAKYFEANGIVSFVRFKEDLSQIIVS